jgi:hypothetical protein
MERVLLFYLVSFAGFVMIVGGIWLLFKEKIYLDRESKQPIQIETPLGKFTSNYPALALFALGFIPLIYPIYAVNNLTDYVRLEPVKIRGLAQANAEPVLVYATRAVDTPSRDGAYKVVVPYLAGGENEYKMLLIVQGRVVDTVHVERDPKKAEVSVNFRSLEIEPSTFKGEIQAISNDFK